MQEIGIIDSGTGNFGSVKNALEKINCSFRIIENPEDLKKFEKIILPGVGSAQGIIGGIKEKGLFEPLKEFLNLASKGKKKFLGICLGLQVLFEESEENKIECFKIFPEKVRRFSETQKVPHMGWNNIEKIRPNELFDNLKEEEKVFYFVHSYFAPVGNWTSHSCKYGEVEFSAAIKSEGIFGVQFHPEKSGKIGLKVLEKFSKI